MSKHAIGTVLASTPLSSEYGEEWARNQDTWAKGPRVRIETLRKGDKFIAVTGRTYTYVRKDDALSGVHHTVDVFFWGVHHTVDAFFCQAQFAGCAEVVPCP